MDRLIRRMKVGPLLALLTGAMGLTFTLKSMSRTYHPSVHAALDAMEENDETRELLGGSQPYKVGLVVQSKFDEGSQCADMEYQVRGPNMKWHGVRCTVCKDVQAKWKPSSINMYSQNSQVSLASVMSEAAIVAASTVEPLKVTSSTHVEDPPILSYGFITKHLTLISTLVLSTVVGASIYRSRFYFPVLAACKRRVRASPQIQEAMGTKWIRFNGWKGDVSETLVNVRIPLKGRSTTGEFVLEGIADGKYWRFGKGHVLINGNRRVIPIDVSNVEVVKRKFL